MITDPVIGGSAAAVFARGRQADPPRSTDLATLNKRRAMVVSRLARRMTSCAVSVMLLLSMITAGIAATAPSADAAGTVLFDQPFHDKTVDGPAGSVSLPTAPTGTNAACLTATGNATKDPLFSCGSSTD